MKVYAAQVASMDAGIDVLDRLKAHDVRDNTLVIFLSDNGAYGGELDSTSGTGQHVAAGARTHTSPTAAGGRIWGVLLPFVQDPLHEGGIAAPLHHELARRIRSKNAVRHSPTHVMDLLPTLLEVAGGQYPEEWK